MRRPAVRMRHPHCKKPWSFLSTQRQCSVMVSPGCLRMMPTTSATTRMRKPRTKMTVNTQFIRPSPHRGTCSHPSRFPHHFDGKDEALCCRTGCASSDDQLHEVAVLVEHQVEEIHALDERATE